jgi:uncharacterized membrane protein
MKNIVVLICLLVLPTAVALLLKRVRKKQIISLLFAARLGLAFLMFITGLTHFTQTDGMRLLLPTWVPAARELILVTGVLEIVAGIGLLIERTARYTAGFLIVFFIAVFPANVWAAFNLIDYGGHSMGPAYLLVRGPLQALLILWSWRVVSETPFETQSYAISSEGSEDRCPQAFCSPRVGRTLL